MPFALLFPFSLVQTCSLVRKFTDAVHEEGIQTKPSRPRSVRQTWAPPLAGGPLDVSW